MRSLIVVAVLLAMIAGGCKKQQPPADEPSHTPPRTDFAPEEFGIGRKHTRNAACNREIDRLLEPVRLCYNSRLTAECQALQQANSDKIARIKNSVRCQD